MSAATFTITSSLLAISVSMNNNTTNNEEEESNPYLAMRKAKIARNQRRLKELGLALPVPQVITPNPPRANDNKRNNQRKVYTGPVRRSGRLSSQVKPDYKDVTLLNEKQIGGSRKRSHDDVAYNDLDTAEDTKTDVSTIAKRVPTYTKSKPGAPAPHSVRSINLNVDKLIFGTTGLLGEMVETTGKEHVINQSFSLSATPYDQERLANAKDKEIIEERNKAENSENV